MRSTKAALACASLLSLSCGNAQQVSHPTNIFGTDDRVGVDSTSLPGSAAGRLDSGCTATLIGEWLKWRGPAHEYLFCPIYKGIAVDRSLSATTVKRLIKQSAALAGLNQIDVDAFSGHSMRVGAAQDLLCAGHDTAAIMRAGGWKSINVLGRYLELAEHNVWA